MKIYISKEGQSTGPFTLPQINAFINLGRLKENDYAWYEGCPSWIRIKDVYGVRLDSSTSTTQRDIRPPIVYPTRLKVSSSVKNPPKATRPTFTKRVVCRICEVGELARSVLPRFSGSLGLMGWISLVIGISCLGALTLALMPMNYIPTGTTPVSIMINGTQSLSIDSNNWLKFINGSQRMILAQWQFLLLTSFFSIVLFAILRSKKQVLQCRHCESVVPIE